MVTPGTPNSEIDLTVSTNGLGGTAEISAIFTDGPLAGDEITPVILEINPNLDCLFGELEYLATSLTLIATG